MIETGFIATEVTRRTDRVGWVLHAFSTDEVRHVAADPQPAIRGVNSFHLLFDGRRWWIFDVVWQSDPAQPPGQSSTPSYSHRIRA